MPELVQMTADIVAARVGKGDVADVADLIQTVHAALLKISRSELDLEEARQPPAVSIRASVKHDHVVCLECGAKLRMMKRHLKAAHDLTIDGYREKWRLPTHHPLVAPAFSDTRSGIAKQHRLGKR